MVLMRIVGIGTHDYWPDNGNHCYLANYDVDANGGRGNIRLTTDKKEALKFQSAQEAMDAWKSQSKLIPLRSDGEPNRPLTAFTIQIEEE